MSRESVLIAECLGVRLLFRDKHYVVVDAEGQQRRYWFAHTAANTFAETVGAVLHRRINAAGIPYPSPPDLAEAQPEYEEHGWWQQILEQKAREAAKRDS